MIHIVKIDDESEYTMEWWGDYPYTYACYIRFQSIVVQSGPIEHDTVPDWIMFQRQQYGSDRWSLTETGDPVYNSGLYDRFAGNNWSPDADE